MAGNGAALHAALRAVLERRAEQKQLLVSINGANLATRHRGSVQLVGKDEALLSAECTS